ncbi:hypothetical protein D3C78_1307030 [compost metagenome]
MLPRSGCSTGLATRRVTVFRPSMIARTIGPLNRMGRSRGADWFSMGMGIPRRAIISPDQRADGSAVMKEPTDQELLRSLRIAWALVMLAIAVPVIAFWGPRPESLASDHGGWFSRSGAVTTIFSLLAESVLVRAKISITPVGFGWDGLQEQRDRFIPKFNAPEWTIFTLTLLGTLIWAYGDLPLKYMPGRV